MRAADPDEHLDMDDSDVNDFEAVPGRNAAVSTCAGVHLEDNPMSPSAKRAYEIPPPVCRIPTQPDIEIGTVPLLVPEDAMEVDFDLTCCLQRGSSLETCRLSMLSTLKLRRFAWYLVGAADVSQFFAYSDEPGTMMVWTDAHWSGKELTRRSTSAGAVRLECFGIEAWSVVQQVVWFSSDENESYAAKKSKADRWETLDHRWNQIRWSGAYPETRAEGVAEQTIQAVEKVPNTIDNINNEAKCMRRTKEKLLGARKALESLTQKAAIAHESRKRAEKAIAVAEFAFASPREPPDKMSPGQDALEKAKECPSDPDTRVQEREAMPRRVRKYGIVAVTSRFATPWNTRTRWSCFGFIYGLTRTSSASDELVESGVLVQAGKRHHDWSGRSG